MKFIHQESCRLYCDNFSNCLSRATGGEQIEQEAKLEGGFIDEGVMICEGVVGAACRAEVVILPDLTSSEHNDHAEAVLGPMAVNALHAQDMLSRGEII